MSTKSKPPMWYIYFNGNWAGRIRDSQSDKTLPCDGRKISRATYGTLIRKLHFLEPSRTIARPWKKWYSIWNKFADLIKVVPKYSATIPNPEYDEAYFYLPDSRLMSKEEYLELLERYDD